MKNLLNNISLLLAFVSLAAFANAQTFKIPVKSGVLQIGEIAGKVSLEAYSGSEVLIEGGREHDNQNDERARGLKPMTGGNDNTNLGLNYKTEGNVTTLKSVRRNYHNEYTIKVPKQMKLKVNIFNSWFDKLKVKGFSSDVNITTRHGDVTLDDISGNLQVNSRHGLVKVTFAQLGNDVNIDARHGGIDITVPEQIKANLRVSTRYGEIYTNMAIKADKQEEGSLKNLSRSAEVVTKLNGGGKALVLDSRHANIYLRKK